MIAKSKTVKKTKFVLKGGPYNGQTVMLTSFGTLPIQVMFRHEGGNEALLYTGRYKGVEWEGTMEVL